MWCHCLFRRSSQATLTQREDRDAARIPDYLCVTLAPAASTVALQPQLASLTSGWAKAVCRPSVLWDGSPLVIDGNRRKGTLAVALATAQSSKLLGLAKQRFANAIAHRVRTEVMVP
jgi:hypothetical protein